METKAEGGTPFKLTKFTYHTTEENVIWVNAATQINHALEANVDFLCDTDNNKTPVVTTTDLEDTAISIYVVGSKPQAYKTRPKGNMGS